MAAPGRRAAFSIRATFVQMSNYSIIKDVFHDTIPVMPVYRYRV